jgi:hypothetical protein
VGIILIIDLEVLKNILKIVLDSVTNKPILCVLKEHNPKETEMIELTTLETKTLVEGIFNNPYYVESGWAWVSSVAEYACLSGPEFRGVFTSLKKKGLVELDGNSGCDACVRPTILACETTGRSFSSQHGQE